LYTPVHIEVRSTEDVPFIVYNMISKGLLIRTDTIFMHNRVGSFSFIPKFSFAPKADFIVYYVRSNGEVVSESESIEFRTQLPNYVALNVSTPSCKPGENVSLDVYSTMHSTVSLMAIDQSVLLLKSGNDITKSDVFANFDRYNDVSDSGPNFARSLMWWNPWWYETYEMKFGVSLYSMMVKMMILINKYYEITAN
jgi:CD109 antigen